MLKKIIINFFLLFVFTIIIFFFSLSTIGIETSRFNELISEKIAKAKNIEIKLSAIKFKLDPKKLSLFLETSKPKIKYKDLTIPTKYLKVYIDFLPLIKADLKIKKIRLSLEELDINQINKLSLIIKPSNLKSFLNNKVLEGKVNSEIELFFNDKGEFENYIARGTIKDLKASLFSDLYLSKINLDFFADKDDILLKNVVGNIADIAISNGDVKLVLEEGIKLNSNFDPEIKLEEKNKKIF